ncbi:hypothetical protein D3C72_1492570 [compost metagenome]
MMWRRPISRTITLSPEVVLMVATCASGIFAPLAAASFRLAMASGLERVAGGKRTAMS